MKKYVNWTSVILVIPNVSGKKFRYYVIIGQQYNRSQYKGHLGYPIKSLSVLPSFINSCPG